MSEAEKQEGQKTVVSFITGLLIGGLLVWVFSSSPESTPKPESEETTTEESAGGETTPAKSETATISKESETVKAPVVGKGSLSVKDQNAGDTVTLSDVTYPNETGWIVVRDYVDGVAGKILGASRFNTTDGLTPTSVSLLRKTVAGATYQVMFFTEDGDKEFSTKTDIAVEGGAAMFKAN